MKPPSTEETSREDHPYGGGAAGDQASMRTITSLTPQASLAVLLTRDASGMSTQLAHPLTTSLSFLVVGSGQTT